MTAVYGLKFILLGDSAVGKSQLMRRFTKKDFKGDSQTTVGMEFSTREIIFERSVIKAQIWDTAGQERFENMTKAYYKDAVGAILVYDIGSRQSFENLQNIWLRQLKSFGHEKLVVILVGNKSDKAEREVSTATAVKLAQSLKIDFVETSALTGENVEKTFRRVVLSVAVLLPPIKVHMGLTGLPAGWIIARDETSSQASNKSLSIDSGGGQFVNSDGADFSIDDRSSESQSRSISEPFPSKSSVIRSDHNYCNFWTGDIVQEFPSYPAPIGFFYVASLDTSGDGVSISNPESTSEGRDKRWGSGTTATDRDSVSTGPDSATPDRINSTGSRLGSIEIKNGAGKKKVEQPPLSSMHNKRNPRSCRHACVTS